MDGSLVDFKAECERQREEEQNEGVFTPRWVNEARLRGDVVRMLELGYWINYTNPVPLNRKLARDEWAQVKMFKLPKKTLKLQVDPEHLDVFLSTIINYKSNEVTERPSQVCSHHNQIEWRKNCRFE